jgi:hypothetical protein
MTKSRPQNNNATPESLHQLTRGPDVALIENDGFAAGGDDGSYPEGGSAFHVMIE